MKKYFSVLLLLVLAGNCYAQEWRWIDDMSREPYEGMNPFDGTWRVIKADGGLYGTINSAAQIIDESGVFVARVIEKDGQYWVYPEHSLDILHRRMFGQQRSDAIKEGFRKLENNVNAVVNSPVTMVNNAVNAVGEAVQKPVVAVQEAVSSAGQAISSAGQAISSASQSVGEAIKKPFAVIGDVVTGMSDKIALVFWLIVGAIGAFICLCIVGILSRIFGAANRIGRPKE